MPCGPWFGAMTLLACWGLAWCKTVPPPFPDHRPYGDILEPGKILDMHAHVAGIGAGGSGCFLDPKIRASFKFGLYLQAFDVREKELRDSGDALLIARLERRRLNTRRIGAVVVLALDGVIHDGKLDTAATQIYVPGDYVRRETLKYPKLLYGASVNPYRPRALQKLRQAALDGAVLIKWIPSIMEIDPADTSLTAFYREMARLRLPLLSHTGTERAFLSAIDSLCDPRRLRLPLVLGVTVIAGHAAVPGRSDGQSYSVILQEMMGVHPNLYADISSLTQINKLGSLKPLLSDSLTRTRLVYGSDYPLCFTRLVSPLVHSYAIGLGRAKRLKAMPEHWDRDVALKKALGVPEEVFLRSAALLLPKRPTPPPNPPPAPKKIKSRKKPSSKKPLR